MSKTLVHIFTFSILFLVSNLYANLLESYGFGAKAIGMAGARSTLARDWTSVYYNIAGMAAPEFKNIFDVSAKMKKEQKDKESFIESELEKYNLLEEKKITKKGPDLRTQAGAGYVLQMSGMNISFKSKVQDKTKNDAEIGLSGMSYGFANFGFVFDMRNLFETPYRIPIKFGLAIALNTGALIKIVDVSQKAYNFKKIGPNVQRLSAMTGIAFQPWKNRLSAGIGANILADGTMQVTVQDIKLDNTSPPVDTITATKVDSRFSPLLGVLYRHPLNSKNSLLAGLTYKGAILLSMDINANVITPVLPVEVKTSASILTFYTPHIITAGFAYIYTRYHIALDLEYQMWSKFPLSTTRTRFEEAPGFKDVFALKLAADIPFRIPLRKIRWLTFRISGGYSFISAFTPDQTKESNYLDNFKHIFSFGISYKLRKNFIVQVPTMINLGFQYQRWTSRDTVKEINDNLQPDYSYGGNIFITSLSLSWKF